MLQGKTVAFFGRIVFRTHVGARKLNNVFFVAHVGYSAGYRIVLVRQTEVGGIGTRKNVALVDRRIIRVEHGQSADLMFAKYPLVIQKSLDGIIAVLSQIGFRTHNGSRLSKFGVYGISIGTFGNGKTFDGFDPV